MAERKFMENLVDGRNDASTKVMTCVVASCLDDSGNLKRAAVSLQSLSAGLFAVPAHDDAAFARTSLMSLEGLFRPYSVETGISGIPHFISPSGGAVRPTCNDLNPFGSGIGESDIDFALSRRTCQNGQTARSDDTHWFQANSARGVGWVGPVILTSWGYDKNGYPVPNSGLNTDKFLPNHRKRFDQWKTGPIDFRWDQSRGVWITGTSPTLAQVTHHSGSIGGRPGYICRPSTGFDGASFTFPTGIVFGEETGDVHTFNIQDSINGPQAIGVGQLVHLYTALGATYMNENSRSLIFY